MYIYTYTEREREGKKEQARNRMRTQGIIFQSLALNPPNFSKFATLSVLNFALLPTHMELGVWRRALIHSYTHLEHLLRHLYVAITVQPNFLS